MTPPPPPPGSGPEAVARVEIDAALGAAGWDVQDRHEMNLSAARLRQSILKWAFEGKLADQDPNDEPASVLLERIEAERAVAAATPAKARS